MQLWWPACHACLLVSFLLTARLVILIQRPDGESSHLGGEGNVDPDMISIITTRHFLVCFRSSERSGVRFPGGGGSAAHIVKQFERHDQRLLVVLRPAILMRDWDHILKMAADGGNPSIDGARILNRDI